MNLVDPVEQNKVILKQTAQQTLDEFQAPGRTMKKSAGGQSGSM
ncbi:MAG: hypothetical protein M3449_09245 [Acidobacteriota bacterium]|nr:hypothetical protein [Acidobacteriota bacterium]MDQ3491228.1 hypothetical protein [Acidobacteriota bacterium]